MKKILVVLLAMTLMACQRRDDTPPPVVQPSTDSHIIELQSENVEEFKLSDGTPCAKARGGDGGITCDWEYNYRGSRRP